MTDARPVSGLLLSDDLIFTSKVTGTARAHGFVIQTARSSEMLEQMAGRQLPSCVILDLSNPGLVIEDLLGKLRGLVTPMPSVVAYGSHVDTATLRRAREAGCDIVLPRSKFVEDLATLLPTWMAARAT